MPKIYDAKTVAHLQSCLDAGSVVIESFDSYENILPGMTIVLGEVRVHFQKSIHPRIPGYTGAQFLSEKTDKMYMSFWNQLPVCSHMCKDFRYLITDMNGNVPYKTFTYTDKDDTRKRALVRYLFEIDDMDADQPECVEYFKQYNDVILNNCCYLIVKIEDADQDGYTTKTPLDMYAIADTDAVVAMPGKKKANSSPLF